MEFVADFKKGEEVSVNCCRLSSDNGLIATGGEDCLVRVFKLDAANGFKVNTGEETKAIMTLEGHCDPVNCVDFSSDSKLLVSSSTDRSCIIFNVDTTSKFKGQRLHKLTFSDGLNDTKNMLMRGCFFSKDCNSVYTLATHTKQKSYLIQWQNASGF